MKLKQNLKETLRVIIVGHVDHGKSTLIGKLLSDLNQIQEEKINEVLSIPGHWHEIVNTGKSKAYFLLWSNEVYDKNKPDTFSIKT